MFILPILIILSLVLYVYYKVAILKSKDALTQSYFNARSRICLGTFVAAFGINQYLFYQSRFSLFIGIAFLILGGIQLVYGYRQSKFYRKEWKRLHPTSE